MALMPQIIPQVWQKAAYIDPKNEMLGFRKDQCGAWIQKSQYGNRNSIYGWEVDHIRSVSSGGGDDLSNLRPLHWKNNAARGDGQLSCVLTSQGVANVSDYIPLYR